MARILITGASGYLGKTLVPLARQNHEVIALASSKRAKINFNYFRYCDLSNKTNALRLLESVEFDAVINAAAINPGGADEYMEAINTQWPKLLARFCAANSKRLVHVSTDMVHDGLNAPYKDDANPSATSLYGTTKAAGEKAIFQHDISAAIVRTSLIYGVQNMDRGTAGFVARINNREQQNLFSDVYRQPIWDKELSLALVSLATEDDYSGLMNIAGSEVISRFDFGMKLLRYWNVDTRFVNKVKAEEFAPAIPRDVRLDIELALKRGFSLSGVDDVLQTT